MGRRGKVSNLLAGLRSACKPCAPIAVADGSDISSTRQWKQPRAELECMGSGDTAELHIQFLVFSARCSSSLLYAHVAVSIPLLDYYSQNPFSCPEVQAPSPTPVFWTSYCRLCNALSQPSGALPDILNITSKLPMTLVDDSRRAESTSCVTSVSLHGPSHMPNTPSNYCFPDAEIVFSACNTTISTQVVVSSGLATSFRPTCRIWRECVTLPVGGHLAHRSRNLRCGNVVADIG